MEMRGFSAIFVSRQRTVLTWATEGPTPFSSFDHKPPNLKARSVPSRSPCFDPEASNIRRVDSTALLPEGPDGDLERLFNESTCNPHLPVASFARFLDIPCRDLITRFEHLFNLVLSLHLVPLLIRRFSCTSPVTPISPIGPSSRSHTPRPIAYSTFRPGSTRRLTRKSS